MESSVSQHWHLVWMISALFLIVYLGSPRHSSRRAFIRIKRLLEQSLDKRRFSQFHGITLPTGGGSEELDHVLVSSFGVFIIVSEFRPGEISGGESQEVWKHKRWGRMQRWPNPIHKAKLQMETLQRILDMPRGKFHLLVVLDGQGKPSPKWPRQLMTTGQLVPFLRSRTEQVLSPEQADRATKMIMEHQLPAKRGLSKTAVVRYALGLMVVTGVFLVYWDDLTRLAGNFDEQVEQLAAPERFDEQGERKSEQQIFEESLMCAFSEDTMRCSCYQKDGEKVEVELDLCRRLSERGSILKQ
jgi:hypothetical protein